RRLVLRTSDALQLRAGHALVRERLRPPRRRAPPFRVGLPSTPPRVGAGFVGVDVARVQGDLRRALDDARRDRGATRLPRARLRDRGAPTPDREGVLRARRRDAPRVRGRDAARRRRLDGVDGRLRGRGGLIPASRRRRSLARYSVSWRALASYSVFWRPR